MKSISLIHFKINLLFPQESLTFFLSIHLNSIHSKKIKLFIKRLDNIQFPPLIARFGKFLSNKFRLKTKLYLVIKHANE